ncbi:FadR/GntR family transcriptional regulator [Paenochrobactrum glaciei]
MSSIQLPQAPRRSLVDSAIDLIRNQIETGVWKVGDRIPKEQELADMLQIGRNTVREAVRVLSHANMLEVRQGDGTYVRMSVDSAEIMRRVNRASLQDHFELRAVLETEAARLAAIHSTKADIALLRQLLNQRGEQHDAASLEKFIEADMALHNAIAQSSKNTALAELYRYFSTTIKDNMLSALSDSELPEPGFQVHRKLIDAIEAHDEEEAVAAVTELTRPLIIALKA